MPLDLPPLAGRPSNGKMAQTICCFHGVIDLSEIHPRRAYSNTWDYSMAP